MLPARAGPDADGLARPAPARIDGQQARKLVNEGARLVDVRTPAEYADGHIDGALNVPLHEVLERSGELGAKDQPLVLYCRSGRRSALAAQKLQGLGFTLVYDLGSKSAW
ncbi:MAG: rhodanese-like domain-containing protein [Deltaproteobacteria bacterium]|nr:rhodanese-like domain-containing protein [Deltaproteobacteria bacterium]